jgi:DNA-binding response OmpR family regulator
MASPLMAAPRWPPADGDRRPSRPTGPSRPPVRDLAVLTWPEEAAQAERLRREGVPRLLLVARDADPPQDVDHLTEWVRVPAEEQEVAARVVALMRRAETFSLRPRVDDHGRITHRDRWAALSPTETRIAAVLCDHFCEVVTTQELRSRAWPPGDEVRAPSSGALRVHLHRFRQRVAVLGLEVVSVRNEGVILQPGTEPARLGPYQDERGA